MTIRWNVDVSLVWPDTYEKVVAMLARRYADSFGTTVIRTSHTLDKLGNAVGSVMLQQACSGRFANELDVA